MLSRCGKTSIPGMRTSKNAFSKLQAAFTSSGSGDDECARLPGIRYKSGALYRLESMFLKKLQCSCSGGFHV